MHARNILLRTGSVCVRRAYNELLGSPPLSCPVPYDAYFSHHILFATQLIFHASLAPASPCQQHHLIDMARSSTGTIQTFDRLRWMALTRANTRTKLFATSDNLSGIVLPALYPLAIMHLAIT